MGTRTDVLSEIDAPEARAVQSDAIDEGIVGDALPRIVSGIARFPFQEQFILAVTIHITYTGIVGRIAVAWLLNGNGEVADGAVGSKRECT